MTEHITTEHITTVSEGGLSNFTVTCSCGKTWGVATSARVFAEEDAARHARTAEMPDDPFDGLTA